MRTTITKSILSVFAIGMIVTSSCKKDEQVIFDKQFTGIYFKTDSIYYSFGVTSLSVQNHEIKIPVAIMGETAATDRTFKVEIIAEKTTAVPGVQYSVTSPFLIRKDSVNSYFTININRAELKGQDFKVGFKLVDENGFSPVNENFKKVVVMFNDKLLMPTFWPTSQLGAWSATKHIKYIEIFRTMEQKAPLTYAAIVKDFGIDMSTATAWPFTYNNSMIKYVTIPLYQYFVEQNPGLGITIPRPAGY